MGKRRGKYNRKGSKLEGVVYLGILIFIGGSFLLNMLAFISWKVFSFFQQLDLLGWTYVVLTCVGLYLLYWMAREQEKRAYQERQYQKRLKIEEYKRKQIIRVKEKNTIEKLNQMDPFQFEGFIKELYDLMGYETQLTQKTGDGGKDIIVSKGYEKSVVECKRYNSQKVTRPDIQKFHSAIIDTKSIRGYFVTTGDFTRQAIEYCIDKPITLINGDALVKIIHDTISNHEDLNPDIILLQFNDFLERKPTS